MSTAPTSTTAKPRSSKASIQGRRPTRSQIPRRFIWTLGLRSAASLRYSKYPSAAPSDAPPIRPTIPSTNTYSSGRYGGGPTPMSIVEAKPPTMAARLPNQMRLEDLMTLWPPSFSEVWTSLATYRGFFLSQSKMRSTPFCYLRESDASYSCSLADWLVRIGGSVARSCPLQRPAPCRRRPRPPRDRRRFCL
jgi:hypothetical protein